MCWVALHACVSHSIPRNILPKSMTDGGHLLSTAPLYPLASVCMCMSTTCRPQLSRQPVVILISFLHSQQHAAVQAQLRLIHAQQLYSRLG